MKRRFFSLCLTVLMLCSLCPAAGAEEKVVPVKLTADEPTLSVILPTSIPMQLKADGTVVCPTDLKIINNSAGPIEVSAITVNETGWGLTDYNGGSRSFLSAMSIGSKKLGLQLSARGDAAATSKDGAQNLSYTKAQWVVGGINGSLPISCAAIASASKTNESTVVGSVVFTIGWSGLTAAESAEPVPTEPYLTFSSPNTFSLRINDSAKHWNGTLEYSKDTASWAVWDGTEPLNSGENESENVLYLRGTGNNVITGEPQDYDNPETKWVLTGSDISCYGNIENLLDYTVVKSGTHPIMSETCFPYMFYGCTNLVSTPSLPAITLSPACYAGMFGDCTSLTTAPALPATTLTEGCYSSMFLGCTALTTAPALSATTLADFCYTSMFSGCTSLTTAPALSATILADYCYNGMFYGCTSLKLSETQTGEYTQAYRVPSSGDGTTADNALTAMFYGTGGTFTGDPTINTTYYLHSSNSIVS